MYLLAYLKSSGIHPGNAIIGFGENSAIINQPQSPDLYDTLLTEFEPKRKQNVNPESLSLPTMENPWSFRPTPDDTLDTSLLDEIFDV